MAALSSWKTLLFFWNNIWIMGCTWLPKLSTYSFRVIRSWRDQQNTVPRYRCTNHRNRIVGFLGCSPNVNRSWSREQREGRLIWHYHARVSSCLFSGFMNMTPSEHYFQ
jgi:hypothetical protein